MCSAATSKQKKLGPFVSAAFANSTDLESTFTGHGASGAKNSSNIFFAASFTCDCGNDFKFCIASQNLKKITIILNYL
jgi:hypothetical protein